MLLDDSAGRQFPQSSGMLREVGDPLPVRHLRGKRLSSETPIWSSRPKAPRWLLKLKQAFHDPEAGLFSRF